MENVLGSGGVFLRSRGSEEAGANGIETIWESPIPMGGWPACTIRKAIQSNCGNRRDAKRASRDSLSPRKNISVVEGRANPGYSPAVSVDLPAQLVWRLTGGEG